MFWAIDHPIGIVVGLLLSATALWAGSGFAGLAGEAARAPNRNERLITYSGCYATAFLMGGAFGCLFFIIRFVKWAWLFAIR